MTVTTRTAPTSVALTTPDGQERSTTDHRRRPLIVAGAATAAIAVVGAGALVVRTGAPSSVGTAPRTTSAASGVPQAEERAVAHGGPGSLALTLPSTGDAAPTSVGPVGAAKLAHLPG
jgi:hypothetical protein